MMPSKIYIRPLALVHGADTRALIDRGEAGALGGMGHIGFTHVEVITRASGPLQRRVDRYSAWAEHPLVRMIVQERPALAGLAMNRCRVMGIVNVTPDSFSDGGRLSNAEAGIAHGKVLASEGADILDVGGESTRPGSDTVADAEELARILPVIAGLASSNLVSADTRKSQVMQAAIEAGARMINDVSALGHDPTSAGVVAGAGVPVILMHAQGEPKTMQLNPRYEHVVLDVYDALEARVELAVSGGIARENICIDPGIGFGKTFAQNLELMAELSLFHGLGVAVLVGLSRKGFVGAVTGEKVAGERVHGSVGGALAAAGQGAHFLRVHDVKATVQALSMFTASHDPDSVEF
jgi:dihydropteroate synthase